MSYTNNNSSLMADDVEKSSTLEDMYRMILGSGGDVPSSFGNFGFSSDDEDTFDKDVRLSETEEENDIQEIEKEPELSQIEIKRPATEEFRHKLSVPLEPRFDDSLTKRLSLPARERLIDPLKPRLSLPREKPVVVKREQKPETSSSSEYEEETEDDENDENEEELEDSETDHDYEYVINDSIDTSQTKFTPVPVNNTDNIQPEDVITDEELDAILDMEGNLEDNTVVETPESAEIVAKVETPRITHTEPMSERNIMSPLPSPPAASTPIYEHFPAKEPTPVLQKRNSINVPILDVEANHRIVNGVQMMEVDSETTGSNSEEEPQVAIVQPPAITPLVQPTRTQMTMKEHSNGTKPVVKQVEKPAQQAFSYHKKFSNDNSYKCCVCCLVTLFCFTIAAFIISIIAITDRCNCEDTTLLKSQLMLLMEERNCPIGWKAYNDSCYGIPTLTKKSFGNAKTSCTQYGGDVVALTSRDENDFITKNIVCPRSGQPNGDDSYYIGLRKKDVGNSFKVYSYTTWDTGERFSYTNSLSASNSTKLCVHINKSGAWTEVDCSSKLIVLCESKIIKATQCGP